MVPIGMMWSRATVGERSPDLKAYLRMEFHGADAEWMGRRIRKAAGRTRGLRARLARPRAPRRGFEEAQVETPPPPSHGGTPVRPAPSADDCPHDEVDSLGRDGPTSFARCRRCGILLIGTRDTLYLLRPDVPPVELTASA